MRITSKSHGPHKFFWSSLAANQLTTVCATLPPTHPHKKIPKPMSTYQHPFPVGHRSPILGWAGAQIENCAGPERNILDKKSWGALAIPIFCDKQRRRSGQNCVFELLDFLLLFVLVVGFFYLFLVVGFFYLFLVFGFFTFFWLLEFFNFFLCWIFYFFLCWIFSPALLPTPSLQPSSPRPPYSDCIKFLKLLLIWLVLRVKYKL